jgi:two-component system response regulator ResD
MVLPGGTGLEMPGSPNRRQGTSPVRRPAEAEDHLFVVLATPSGAQRRLDSAALMRHGLRTAAVDTVDELREVFDRTQPDLAVLDSALTADRPGAVLALVRAVSTPVVAVAVRHAAARVELLLAGVADCLPVPYASEELAARVVAIGRRIHWARTVDVTSVLRVGPVQLDMRTRTVLVDDFEVALTAMEFDLLACFLRHPGEVLTRDRLLAEVWGYPSGAAETVTVHVRRLRAKIEADPTRPALIQTVWGLGYRLRA